MSSVQHSSADHAPHPAKARAKSASAARHPHRARGGYTLAHGGRQVRIGPVAFWIVVGTLVIMGLWSIGTGTYFTFRDSVLSRLISRHAKMQIAYEDRIADLRAQIDRITSRQLLDQEQFEQKLDALLKRQATLEERTSRLADDFGPTGSIPRIRNTLPDDEHATVRKPKPISDTIAFRTPPDREARLQSREAPTSLTSVASLSNGAGLDGVLTRASDSLDKVAKRQSRILTDLEQHYSGKARRMHNVLADLGVAVKPVPPHGVGGPFVPLKPPAASASTFVHQIYRIDLARAAIDRYKRTLVNVPVRKPVAGPVDMSSPFGVRTDPFNGRPAMHTGLDLRGDIGEPVHATAAGRVTSAGWDGGYGRMVEIDHGNGLSTRYGHMSKIEVKVGQHVGIGQEIGRIGSTGRSTGPHLHYETRINGEAVDPQKFLRAGIRLGSL